MKKGLIFLLGIISFLGINTVNAEEIYLEYETNVNQIKPYIDEIGYDAINNAINENIKYYNENLAIDYPYYFISLLKSDNSLSITLTSFDNFSDYFGDYFNQTFNTYVQLIDFTYNGSNRNIKQISYNMNTNSFTETTNNISLFILNSDVKTYYPYNYYYSNFDLYYKGSILNGSCVGTGFGCLSYLSEDDILYIPYLDGSDKYYFHNANTDFLLESYYLYDGNTSLKNETYSSINLNDYSYVALSLKDYDTIPESNSSDYTNLYIKGQLCITPVYNYGQTERKDILTGTQVQGCSQYYNDFTLTRMYILKDDVKNHAIYYLKAYDTSKENYVKVDTSKFNITYITEENKDNPQVNINGKIYPTLSYDSLTDTSTKSEEEGYLPGSSCAFGDFNCYTENNADNMFNDLFDKPLDTLKSVWNSISSIFELISEFISLLPDTMQTFLYISFTIAIILGLLKIIL